MRYNRLNLRATVITAGLLEFSDGMIFSWASAGIAKLQLTSDDNPLLAPITTTELSWLGSSLYIGTMLGPPLISWSILSIGRKWSLFALAIPFIIAPVTFAFATNITAFCLARFISGLSYGGCMILFPIYLNEISEKTNRGALGTTIKAFQITGAFIPYVTGPYLSHMWYTLTMLIPTILFIPLFFFFIPETPNFLITHGNEEDAKIILRKLHGNSAEHDFEELNNIVQKNKSISVKSSFRSGYNIKALCITIGLFILMRLCGVNVIQTYTQLIMEESNTSLPAHIAAMIVAGAAVIASLITPIFIDHHGRKFFLIISASGMALASTVLGIYLYLEWDQAKWLPIVCIVSQVFAYSLGVVSVPGILLAELIPTKFRSRAAFISVISGAAASFTIIKIYPYVAIKFGEYTAFWFFAFINCLIVIYTILFVPETKAKTFSQLELILHK